MIVTVKPVGREEFALSIEGQPVFSSTILGGYESRQVSCELDDEQRINALGARVRIHGTSGIAWQGIVTKRPGRGEPLQALGWGWCATLGRREAIYCDTSTSAWSERTWEGRSGLYSLTADTALRYSVEGSVSLGTKDNGFWRIIPSTGVSRVSFSWYRPSTELRLRLYSGVTSGASEDTGTEATWTQRWEQDKDTGSTSGTATVDISATHDALLLWWGTPDGWTPSVDQSGYFSNVKVYGVDGVTSSTTANVFESIIDTEVGTDYLAAGAAYRDWISAETTVVEPLVFDSVDAATKLSELTKYAAYDYGWYMEDVSGSPACVPHWTARSTTPDYIIRLDESEAYDIDESALDELVSVVRVNYNTADGTQVYVDVTDTDTSHPLVALGITRYGDISVQTSSSATATSVGQLYLSEYGRSQVKGSVTTMVVRSATGASVYPPTIRPGRMARVLGLPDGQRDCIIRRVTMTGDAIADIELDNEPYRLELYLARIEKRGPMNLPSIPKKR